MAIRALEIEKSTGLPELAPYLVVAWALHAALPKDWRPPAFLALSLGAILLHMGTAGLWVIGIGLGLVGIAHLPAPTAVKGALFAVAVGVLAALRVGVVEVGWAPAVLPILGSMFMFRLVLYVREPAVNQATWATRLGYFFGLPNALFPLYPIIDWTLWRKSPSTPLPLLHRRGVQWIVRGVAHLLLYRVVYHVVLPAPWEVIDAYTVLQWILGIYLLYLRISGQFHLIVGILLLFDKELPETHHLYFFASSFNDYWRRVNVYWTHFVEKIVFYPAFLRLRRLGVREPLVVAIYLTFFSTWALHSYQWFWLRGAPLLTVTDAVFWAMLGTCLAVNSVWEARHPKAKGAQTQTLGAMIVLSAQTVAFFCTIATMWSFWFCESFEEWFHNVSLLAVRPEALLVLALAVVLAIMAGVVLQVLTGQPHVAGWRARYDGERNVNVSLAGCLALVAFAAMPRMEHEPPWVAQVRDAVATEHLNEQDMMARTRGYYENLQPRGNLAGQTWEEGAQRPAGWKVLRDTEFVQEIGQPLQYELLPNQSGRFMDAEFRTNSYGMRDQDYPLEKPPGTLRIALLGASYTMGSGVANDQIWESLVEQRLNEQFAGGRYQRYEILNFGVAGYTTPQVVASYAAKARQFQPDIVIITEVDLDDARLVRQFAGAPAVMLEYPNPVVRDAAKQVWGGGTTSPEAAAQKLRPLTHVLTRALYRQLVEEATADGALPVWLFLPRTEPSDFGESTYEARVERARSAGLTPLSLNGAFGKLTREDLAVAPWDEHPNARGHQLLADALVKVLEENDEALGLGLKR